MYCIKLEGRSHWYKNGLNLTDIQIIRPYLAVSFISIFFFGGGGGGGGGGDNINPDQLASAGRKPIATN